MRKAFAALWGSIILSLTAFNRSIKTVDLYVSWAEAEAQAFVDEEIILRAQRQQELELELAKSNKEAAKASKS